MSNPDDKLVLTVDEAISLLSDREYVHNFADGGMILIGCDYGREEAIHAFRKAVQIELGGSGCKSMGHPIVVWSSERRHTFFEADMAKVAALEAAKGVSQ